MYKQDDVRDKQQENEEVQLRIAWQYRRYIKSKKKAAASISGRYFRVAPLPYLACLWYQCYNVKHWPFTVARAGVCMSLCPCVPVTYTKRTQALGCMGAAATFSMRIVETLHAYAICSVIGF